MKNFVFQYQQTVILQVLCFSQYYTKGILEKIMEEEPAHGLNWSAATKKLFSRKIAKEDKDFAAISKRLKRKAGDCQVRYS